MLSKDKLTVNEFDLHLDISHTPSFNAAKLVYVNGSGQLTSRSSTIVDSEFGHRFVTQMMLNDIPLLKIDSPGCPTCSSILATGYGIDKANCNELHSIRENVNREFVSLDASIKALKPLLALLKSGLYVIADAICYPVDGNGRFFWSVPNEPTENQATAGVSLYENDYTYVDGRPVFLYPTQNTDCLNYERVQYYIDVFKKTKTPPRAVVYNFSEFICFIIDGHHKACAASLLGIPLHCIIINPFICYGYEQIAKKMVPTTLNFAPIIISKFDIAKKYLPSLSKQWDIHQSVDITAGTIIKRVWEKAYLDTAKKYPTVTEYADMISAGISDISTVTNEYIAKCIANLSSENQQMMKGILFMMAKHNDPRLKLTALTCAKKLPYCNLKVQAYKTLLAFKNDPEVEQLFVDYLIDCEDRHDPLISIINAYWV